MEDEEQKCPTTPSTSSWSTSLLATATACLGSQASSALTSTSFLPPTPPLALMSWAAWKGASPKLFPEGGVRPRVGSRHADLDDALSEGVPGEKQATG